MIPSDYQSTTCSITLPTWEGGELGRLKGSHRMTRKQQWDKALGMLEDSHTQLRDLLDMDTESDFEDFDEDEGYSEKFGKGDEAVDSIETALNDLQEISYPEKIEVES